MVSLFDGVFYCHDLGIVHRNLKPENLFLTKHDLVHGDLKIANFGVAR
jgi:serine/threonine protein kinase